MLKSTIRKVLEICGLRYQCLITEYNSGRMKLATVARNCLSHEIYAPVQIWGFENRKKSMEHNLKLQRISYGLTLMELRITAFKFVHGNGIKSQFSAAKGMAVYDWATRFFSCHPGLLIS
jgi:hypothetical protein